MTESKTLYLQWEMTEPYSLLRRQEGYRDEIFIHGQWMPTHLVTEWFFGKRSDVWQITEDEARKVFPEAFLF